MSRSSSARATLRWSWSGSSFQPCLDEWCDSRAGGEEACAADVEIDLDWLWRIEESGEQSMGFIDTAAAVGAWVTVVIGSPRRGLGGPVK